jgi:integrase
MSIKCTANEQVKRVYFHFLEHADGKSQASIKQVNIALGRFEDFTGHADFKTFDQKQAVAFKEDMRRRMLAPATILATVRQVMRFLHWLASTQPGYKSRIRRDAIDYMNLSEKAVRAACAPRDRDYPTLGMIEAALEAMPHQTSIEKRDRALVALSALTAIRVKALTTLKLKHFDRRRFLIVQQPDQVETKNSKRIDTYLIPVSASIEAIFLDWIDYLQNVELFGPGDPIFPQTRMGLDANRQFAAIGLERAHWKQTASARAVVQKAFEAASLPPFGPHSFRAMIVSEMYRRDLSIAAFRAGSQNLGHENVLTTLTSYGKLTLDEQGALIRAAFSSPHDGGREPPVTMSALKALLKEKGVL